MAELLSKQAGREISEIFLSDGQSVVAEPGNKIIAQNEFHGEYDLNWAIEITLSGVEVKRWNLRLVEGFVWADREQHAEVNKAFDYAHRGET